MNLRKYVVTSVSALTLLGIASGHTQAADDNGVSQGQNDQSQLASQHKDNPPQSRIARRADVTNSEVILANDDRHRIMNTTTGHYNGIAFLMSDKVKVASGVVVGKDTLLTNKHVMKAATNGISAAPGANGVNTYPYGQFQSKDFVQYPGNGDLVVVHFKPNTRGQHIGDVVSPVPLGDASQVQQGDSMTVTGYPADKPLASMWESKGKIIGKPGNQLAYDASTYGGNSGSPVFNDQRQVIGVHFGGVDGKKNSAVALSGDVLDFVKRNLK